MALGDSDDDLGVPDDIEGGMYPSDSDSSHEGEDLF